MVASVAFAQDAYRDITASNLVDPSLDFDSSVTGTLAADEGRSSLTVQAGEIGGWTVTTSSGVCDLMSSSSSKTDNNFGMPGSPNDGDYMMYFRSAWAEETVKLSQKVTLSAGTYKITVDNKCLLNSSGGTSTASLFVGSASKAAITSVSVSAPSDASGDDDWDASLWNTSFSDGWNTTDIEFMVVNDGTEVEFGVEVNYVSSCAGFSLLLDNFKLYQGVTFANIADGDYLVVNAVTGNYLAGGLTYGTQSMEGGKPQFFTFASKGNGEYTLDSHQTNGGDSHYLGTGLYVDAVAANWVIEEAASGYALYNETAGGYLTGNGLQVALTAEATAGATAVWTLVTKNDVIASMADATEDNPVDVSALIPACEPKRNAWGDVVTTGVWTATGYNVTAVPTNYAFGQNNNVASVTESYHSGNGFDIRQTVPSLPAGKYTLTAHAFYRLDTANSDTPVMYAGDMTNCVELPSFAGGTTGAPDNMVEAYAAFLEGDYPVSLDFTVDADDTNVLVGFTSAATASGQWTIFGELGLLYYGVPEAKHYEFVNTDWISMDAARATADDIAYTDGNTITVTKAGENNVALANGSSAAGPFSTENYYINDDETWFVVVASDVAYEKTDSYLWYMDGDNKGTNIAPDVVVALNSDNSTLLFAWDLTTSGIDDNLTPDADGYIMLDGWTGFGLTAASETAVISDINFYSWEEAVEAYPQLANVSDDDEYTIGDVVSSADLGTDDERDYTVVSNNLFVNGGFNDGPNGWTAGGYETPATPDDADFLEKVGFNGLNCVETSGAGASSNKTLSQAVAVEVGKTYLFVGYTSGTTPGEDNLRYNALFQMSDATTEVDHEEDGKTYSNDIIRMQWGAAAGSGTSAGSRIEPDGTASTWTRTIGVFTAETPYVGMRMGWNSKSCFDAFQLYEVETAFIEDGEYLLVDSETGLYAGGGLAYGTELTMLNEPQFFGFEYNKDELGYTVDSHQYNTATLHYLGLVSGNTDNPWTDSGEQYWKVNSEGHGGYTLSIAQGGDTYYLVAGAKAQDAVTLSTTAADATVWNFVTREDVIATMDDATNDSPVDVTALIAAPELKRFSNTSNYQTWEQEGTINYGLNSTSAANCAEVYHEAFEVKQTLTDLKAGTYKLSAQGFYRIDTAAEEEIPAVMFTSVAGIAEFMNLTDTLGVTSSKTTNSEMNMATAYEDFLAGIYPVVKEFTVTEEEAAEGVEIGFSGSEMDGRWVIFGELNLLYYGPATEPVIVHEEEAEFAHWTISPEPDGESEKFELNTWSTEADESGMKTPFIEYWHGSGNNLDDATISHTTLEDLKAGYYVVSIDARAFNENSLDSIKAGIVLSANGTSMDLSLGNDGVYNDVSAESYGTYEVPCMVGEDGTLDISFTLTDVNCDWLAFKNLTVTYYPDPSEILPATPVTAVDGEMSTACEEAMEAAIAAYEAAPTAENAVALYQALADAQLCANFYASVADALAQLEEYLDEDGLAALQADENVVAYEAKTLEPCNMLDTYLGAVKAQTTSGVDLTMVLLDTEWIGQTGTYLTGVEHYGDEIEVDGDEPVKVLYQHIDGLVPGATYELTFYAVANNAWVGAAVGDGIAQAFANDETVDVTVYDQTGFTDLSVYSYTFTVTVGSDGVLEYGLQNIATGGNWYVAQAVSLVIANNSDDEYKIGDEAEVEGKSYTVIGENLFANGGFNQAVGTDGIIPGWTQGNGETNYVAPAMVSENTTITEGLGYNGLAYITTHGAGATSENTLTQAVAVVPGKQYLFVGYTSGTTPTLDNLRYNALFVMANDTTEANHLEDDGKTYSDEIIRLLWGAEPSKSTTPDGTPDTWTRTAGVFTATSDYVGMRMGWNSGASFDAFQLYEVEGNEIEDGEYLIATTDADGNTLYIGGGLDYNTELTLLKKPQFFGVAYDEETGGYTIDSHQYRNEENHYLYETADGGVYTDGTVDATQWTIYPVKEEDEDGVMTIVGYTISDENGNYLAAGNVQEAVTLTTDPDETTTWTFITKEDVIASMSEAKHNNPVDATALIAAPEMKNYTNTTWWPTWNAPQNVSFGYNHPTETGANCAEAYHVAFEIDQTLEGLPVGNYKLMAQGFHRDDLSQESYITPIMFVDDAEAELLSIDSPVGADATFVTPDDMPTAYTAFLAENYPVEISFAVTEEGQEVVIGFEGEDTNEWVCFGELTLLYYGEDTSVDLVAHAEEAEFGHWSITDHSTGIFQYNTWSVEDDDSGMKTPFIEYWIGAGSVLEAATISHKQLVGLPEGNYEVSLDIRVLNENGVDVEAGTTFSANGVSEDLVTGADSHDSSFNGNDDVYGTYTVACEVTEEGTLDIAINIPEKVTYDWIAFKNLTVTMIADEAPEVAVYGDGAPMNAEVEATMEEAVEAYNEDPTSSNFTAAIDAIQDAAASIEVYEEIAALVEALDETGTEAWEATESATAFEEGTLVSLDEIEEDMTAAQAAQTTAVTDWTYVLKYTGEWKHDEASSVINFQMCPALPTAHEAWRSTTFGGSEDEPSMPLYKEITGLRAGTYEISFYAYAAQGDLGDVIVFANDSISTIAVDTLGVGPNWSNVAEQITLTCTVGADGILDFGLKCIGAGAWYVAEEGTLTLLEVITEMPYEFVNNYWVATDLEANPESIVYNDGNTITVEGTTIGLGTRVLTTDKITTENMYVTEDQNLLIVVADDIDGEASLLRWTNGNDNDGLALAPDTVVTLLDGQVLVMWDITELEKAADAEGKIFLDGWTAFALTSTSGESTISDICFYDWDTAVETYPELGWDEDMRAIVERYVKDCDTANATIAELEARLEEDPDDLDAADQLEALTITMHGDGYSIAYGEYDIYTTSYDDLYEACIVIENVLLATQITEVETATSAPEGIYTLDGVRVSKITKSGIYIVDGKKVLVK